jgi:hypothetical protein
MISLLLSALLLQGGMQVRPLWVLEQTMTPRGSSLIVADSSSGPKPGTGLYLADIDGMRLVRDLNDLRGRVTLDSSELALQYVRLRTSPVAHIDFEIEAEIAPRGDLTPAFFYGQMGAVREVLTSADGYYGLVSDATFARVRLRKARVEKVAKGYKITRSVLVRDLDGTFLPREIQEMVESDGRYVLVSMIPLEGEVTKIPWYMPIVLAIGSPRG